jgi:IclR family KDG regulon transcriptional repressor
MSTDRAQDHALTGETVTLAELDGSQALYIHERNSGQAFGLRIDVGLRAPCHATAVGKAILAFLPPSEQAALLEQIGVAKGKSAGGLAYGPDLEP